MKKIIFTLITLSLSASALATTHYSATTECQFDYDDVNFCSKANIAKYQKALKTQKPNFNKKYIILDIHPSRSSFRFVAVDTKSGLVLPLRDEILGFKDNKGELIGKPPIIKYSLNDDSLCIFGSVHAYRDAYDNVRVCYSIQNDEYSKYGKEFSRIDVPDYLD